MHRIALYEIHPDLTQDRKNLVRLDLFSHSLKPHLMADSMDGLDHGAINWIVGDIAHKGSALLALMLSP